MRRLLASPSIVGLVLWLAVVPTPLAAQGFGGSSRAHLFVYLAYAAAWVVIGFWVVRIGRMVRRLASVQPGDRS